MDGKGFFHWAGQAGRLGQGLNLDRNTQNIHNHDRNCDHSQIGKLANWLKGSGSALLCLRPLVLITGKYNWGDGDEA